MDLSLGRGNDAGSFTWVRDMFVDEVGHATVSLVAQGSSLAGPAFLPVFGSTFYARTAL
jgi:hypothetical protein